MYIKYNIHKHEIEFKFYCLNFIILHGYYV